MGSGRGEREGGGERGCEGGWVLWSFVEKGKVGQLPGKHKRQNQRVKVRRVATGERRPIPNFAGKTSANPLPLLLPRIPTLFQQLQPIIRSWDRSPVAALNI